MQYFKNKNRGLCPGFFIGKIIKSVQQDRTSYWPMIASAKNGRAEPRHTQRMKFLPVSPP